MAFTVEAFQGFVLLTAGISWVLSIKPVLAHRRGLALSSRALLDAGRRSDTPWTQLPGADARQILVTLTHDISLARAQLMQSPETYYFHPGAGSSSLASALVELHRGTDQLSRTAGDVALRFHATRLRLTLEEFAKTLEQFLHLDGARRVTCCVRTKVDQLCSSGDGSRPQKER